MSRYSMLAVAATVLGTGGLHAQGGTGGVVHTAPTPRVTITGVSGASSLSSWPGIAMSVDSDAYVTVFAVTRTKGSALPIQLLAPARPGDARPIKAGAAVSQRRLNGEELLHLLHYGSSPMVVAFASREKPDLASFQAGSRWGRDLLIDTLAQSDRQVVEILANTLFARGVPFNAMVSAPNNFATGEAGADSPLGKGPITVSQFERSNGTLVDKWLDPVIMTADLYQLGDGLPFPLLYGVPFTLKGGARVSIERGANGAEYRVAYWPQENRPPTAEQRAGQATTGVPQSTLITTPDKTSSTPKTAATPSADGVVRPPGR